MPAMSKALILGGTGGLLGKALVETLVRAGWEVESGGISRKTDLSKVDLSQELASLITKFDPDVVFNTIGYTQVDQAEEDVEGTTMINRTYPAIVARVVKEHGSRLVHYSTDFVFDGKGHVPYRETDEPNPLSVYGRTKLEGEEAIVDSGLEKYTIIRTAWLFGSGKKNFISTILDLCNRRNSLNVVHDQIGSPTYTIDLAEHSLSLVEADANGVFHVVNSGVASWCDFAGEAARLAEVACAVHPITSSEYPQKAVRPAYSVLDTGRFTKMTGITPRPWAQALRDYIYRDFLLK